MPYLGELRLQNLDRLNLDTLRAYAERATPKLRRAVRRIVALVHEAYEDETP